MLPFRLRCLPRATRPLRTQGGGSSRGFAALHLLRASCRHPTSHLALAPHSMGSLQSVTGLPRRFFSSYPEHQVLTFPSLSPTMDRGNLPEWGKGEGEEISAGDIIAMVETDKATLPWESTEDGYIAKHLIPEGTTDIDVGTPVAILVEDADDIAAFANYTAADAAPAPAETPKDTPAPAAAPPASPTPPAAPVATPAPSSSPSPASTPASGPVDRVMASPYARTVAKQRGVDISAMSGVGTGLRGMVVASDVETFTPATATATATATTAAPAAAAAGGLPGEFVDVPHSMMRKVIAQRLSQSKQTIPHYYLSIDVCMDQVMATRAKLNKQLEKAGKPKLSVNDFVIKASASALQQVKEVNSSWLDTAVRTYNYVDISVAVSTDSGLITPIVRDADLKGLSDISSDVRDLATRAKENKLLPQEYQGGTFTISNLGMFGVKNFSAIVNPPQAAILAVGTTEARLVPNDSEDSERNPYKTSQFMAVTLSCDHRVVDGAVGAQWLKAFKNNLEDPLNLLL